MAVLQRQKQGFSLVEMVVVLGAMVMVMTLTLANFPKIKEQIALTLATRELALTIRKAQSYAIAVREFNSSFPVNLCNSGYDVSQGSVMYPPYGISVSKSGLPDSLGRDQWHYVIFGDITCRASRSQDPVLNAATMIIDVISIQNGVQIATIKGFAGGPPPTVLDAVDIVYQRPNPSVTLIGYKNGTGSIYSGRIEISLTSGDGSATQKLIARPSGQISIE